MTTHPTRLTALLKLQAVQGIIAAAVGLGAFFLSGVILSGFPNIQNFVFENMMYQALRSPATMTVIFWGNVMALLAGLITFVIITAVAGSLIVLVFRWLGVRPVWKAIRRFIGLLIAFNTIAYIVIYILSVALSSPGLPSLWVQVLQAYLPILAFALPYPSAWLIATRVRPRKQKS